MSEEQPNILSIELLQTKHELRLISFVIFKFMKQLEFFVAPAIFLRYHLVKQLLFPIITFT